MENNQNFVLLDNSIVKSKVSIFRDKYCSCEKFRQIVNDLSIFLCYEACKNLKLSTYSVETPIETTTGYKLESKISVVEIMRAGLGMVPGFLKIIPDAHVGHIGVSRNETTLIPSIYYCKLPENISKTDVFLVDPMLATGGSSSSSIEILKQKGVEKITFLCLIAAPAGVEKLQKDHPDVQIFAASLDDHLNEKGYIVPGLGDAGDRVFNTL